MCILRFSNESLPGVFDAYLRCLRHPCAHERNMHSPHCCVFTVVAQCLASRGKPQSAIFMRIYVVWGLSGVHRQACESHFGHPIRGIWLHFSCVLMGFGPHMVAAVKSVKANSMRIYSLSGKQGNRTKAHRSTKHAYLRHLRYDDLKL